ncbi:MAG: hypothetical protein WCG10_05220 [Chlamydiota bacterium]
MTIVTLKNHSYMSCVDYEQTGANIHGCLREYPDALRALINRCSPKSPLPIHQAYFPALQRYNLLTTDRSIPKMVLQFIQAGLNTTTMRFEDPKINTALSWYCITDHPGMASFKIGR